MKFSTKILGAVAVAGLIATGGSAFTAAGLTLAGGQESRFVGGTVSQNVVGATLSTIVYGYADQGAAKVSSLTLTFVGANGKSVSALLHGTGPNAAPPVAGTTGAVDDGALATKFTCSTVTANESTCTFKNDANAVAAGAYIPDLTDIDITVS